jgi:D-alanine-D-alanine ligase
MTYKKRGVIALVYHYVPKKTTDEFFNSQQAIVDNQTDEIVSYMRRLFLRRGYKVQMLKVSPDNLTDLKKLKADFVFNLVDSKSMEVRIAKILDRVRIPHSGSSFEAIKTSNNKIKSKRLFEKNKLPTPKYSLISPTTHITRSLVPGKFPVIIKPAFEHCSIGITDKSIASTYEQFKRIIRSMRKKYK